MTVFKFTDASLGKRFGASTPVLAGIGEDFPRGLIPARGASCRELLVGRREVAELTSLILGLPDDRGEDPGGGGGGSDKGKTLSLSHTHTLRARPFLVDFLPDLYLFCFPYYVLLLPFLLSI